WLLLPCLFSLTRSADPRDLHSFPTRRSSDLPFHIARAAISSSSAAGRRGLERLLADRPPRALEVRPRIPAQSGKPALYRVDAVAVGPRRGIELLPADRHGDARAGPGARRVRANRCRAAAVAQKVDEDPAVTARLCHVRREAFRLLPREAFGDRARKLLRRSQSACGNSGTTRCSPLPPVSFAKLLRPMPSRH